MWSHSGHCCDLRIFESFKNLFFCCQKIPSIFTALFTKGFCSLFKSRLNELERVCIQVIFLLSKLDYEEEEKNHENYVKKLICKTLMFCLTCILPVLRV